MISYISGKILSTSKNKITILTNGGVGYEVYLTVLHSAELLNMKEVALPVYLKVSESSLELFGFRDLDEKRFFELLLSVKGVGPKNAMNILSIGSIDEIQSAIGRGDVKYLTAVQGMGTKTAERLVVELKSKVAKLEANKNIPMTDAGNLGEVVEALVSMGYNKEEVRDAVKTLDGTKPVGILLKDALKMLG